MREKYEMLLKQRNQINAKIKQIVIDYLAINGDIKIPESEQKYFNVHLQSKSFPELYCVDTIFLDCMGKLKIRVHNTDDFPEWRYVCGFENVVEKADLIDAIMDVIYPYKQTEGISVEDEDAILMLVRHIMNI